MRGAGRVALRETRLFLLFVNSVTNLKPFLTFLTSQTYMYVVILA